MPQLLATMFAPSQADCTTPASATHLRREASSPIRASTITYAHCPHEALWVCAMAQHIGCVLEVCSAGRLKDVRRRPPEVRPEIGARGLDLENRCFRRGFAPQPNWGGFPEPAWPSSARPTRDPQNRRRRRSQAGSVKSRQDPSRVETPRHTPHTRSPNRNKLSRNIASLSTQCDPPNKNKVLVASTSRVCPRRG